METSPVAIELSVLMLITRADLRDRCTAVLSELNARVWTDWSQVPAEATVDIILRDAAGPMASAHGWPGSVEPASAGLIQLGPGEPADVSLAADCSPVELKLACTLLAQIVRLRRKLQERSTAGGQLFQEAFCDPLTQLPNLRAWEEQLARRMSESRLSGEPLCLALIDLDHFKQVNDGWGHAAGDQLLVAAGSALRESLRQNDFLARLGGDEFGLLLSGLDSPAAAAVLERVRSGLPARIAQSTPHVPSVSVGYAIYRGEPELTAAALSEAADQARRLAKRRGRDCAVSAAAS